MQVVRFAMPSRSGPANARGRGRTGWLGGLNAAAQQEDWVAVATAADQARRNAVRVWAEFDVILADAF